jgi:flagellar biosynthesis protein FlhF
MNEPRPSPAPVQAHVQPASLPPQPPQPPVSSTPVEVVEPVAKSTGEVDMPPMLGQMIEALRFQGVEEAILKKVTRVSLDTLSPRVMQDERRVREFLHKQLEASIHILKESSSTLPQVIFLVGSSGAGKTSTCAKLAVHYTKNFHQKVVWICADTVRIGAIAEARTYTDTIGIPLRLAYTPEDLISEIEQVRGEADIILVDTPAFNPRKEESIVDLGALLTAVPKRTTWMVIPSTAKEIDLQNAISALGPFRPKAIIVSKLDETNSFSSVFNLAARTQLPFAYFTFGRRVLNDISVANSNQFVKALLDERFVA